MSRTDLSNLPVLCVVCAADVPEARRKHKSITCSKEHQKMREASFRHKKDRTKCRYCDRPSTPEQQVLFSQWRRLQGHVRATPALSILLTQVQDPEGFHLLGLYPKERAHLVKLLERILAQDQPPDLPPLPTKAQKRDANNEARRARLAAMDDEMEPKEFGGTDEEDDAEDEAASEVGLAEDEAANEAGLAEVEIEVDVDEPAEDANVIPLERF